MTITENLNIIKRTNGTITVIVNGSVSKNLLSTDAEYEVYNSFYTMFKNTQCPDREKLLANILATNRYPQIFGDTAAATPDTTETAVPVKTKEEILTEGISGLMNFFTEFSFVPSYRFTNTLAFIAAKGVNAAKEYISNYFALMDSSYVSEVKEKMNSAEFRTIIANIKQYGTPSTHVNNRLKIYYGSAGTGKTTIAQQEAENRCIVCNSSMLPSDLMEDFMFKDGNPDFNPSLLWDCMEQGKTIVLDEINLLPFDSLRFLQGIVDGKSQFYYKNRPVNIHDGFQIIGTMNLSLGGMTYGLPEPLVDRCSEAKEFVLTAEQLAKAIIRQDGE